MIRAIDLDLCVRFIKFNFSSSDTGNNNLGSIVSCHIS